MRPLSLWCRNLHGICRRRCSNTQFPLICPLPTFSPLSSLGCRHRFRKSVPLAQHAVLGRYELSRDHLPIDHLSCNRTASKDSRLCCRRRKRTREHSKRPRLRYARQRLSAQASRDAEQDLAQHRTERGAVSGSAAVAKARTYHQAGQRSTSGRRSTSYSGDTGQVVTIKTKEQMHVGRAEGEGVAMGGRAQVRCRPSAGSDAGPVQAANTAHYRPTLASTSQHHTLSYVEAPHRRKP